MIKRLQGNILHADAEALVNTVNCVGVMGKGVALQFRQAFPDNYEYYRKACNVGSVQVGRVLVWESNRLQMPKYIINFPTKKHWRGNSQMQFIESGLESLREEIQRHGIRSVAIPPLGCGHGGLDWNEVRPRIEQSLESLPDVEILLYEPGQAPSAESMKVDTPDPGMTLSRAMIVLLLQQYTQPGYRLTMLEIQKLAYFLQVAGEPLKLRFVKHKFGPYAENLNHALQRLEGHYLRGYGDRSGRSSVRVTPAGLDKAECFLATHDENHEARERLDRVRQLIEGFETPYGMELLATVHWVSTEQPDAARNSEQAMQLTYAWNKRKKDLFKPEHIETAWGRLRDKQWLASG